MAPPTVKQQRARINAIAATAPATLIKTVITGAECDLEQTQLPAFICAGRAATRERLNRDQREVRREYAVLYLCYKMQKGDETEQRTALDAVDDVIDELPDFFDRLTRLELSNKPLDGIKRTEPMSDDGSAIIAWGGSTYAGVEYTYPVIVSR